MGQWSSEATESSFEAEVLERSHGTPVLVDFWAEWCGPCRTLTPILEAAVEARNGAVWLVKINVDQNPRLAAEFGVRGIPLVKAFAGGRFVSEFVGMRPREAIDAFIDRLQPSVEEEALKTSAALLSEQRFDEAITALQPALDHPQYQDAAQLLSAQIQVANNDFAQARATLQRIADGSIVETEARGLLLRIDLIESAAQRDEKTLRQLVSDQPDDPDARWALAGRLVALDQIEGALDQLIELVQRDRKYRDDGGRRAMLAIFDALGQDHDLTREYRRRLQIYV